jgi:hypothetical protein
MRQFKKGECFIRRGQVLTHRIPAVASRHITTPWTCVSPSSVPTVSSALFQHWDWWLLVVGWAVDFLLRSSKVKDWQSDSASGPSRG